jgi:hypothetical protein
VEISGLAEDNTDYTLSTAALPARTYRRGKRVFPGNIRHAKAFDLVTTSLTQLSRQRKVDIGPLAKYLKRRNISADDLLGRALTARALTLYETQEVQTLLESFDTAQCDVNIIDLYHYNDREAAAFEKALQARWQGPRRAKQRSSKRRRASRMRQALREQHKLTGLTFDITAQDSHMLNGVWQLPDECIGDTDYKTLLEKYSHLKPPSLRSLRKRARLIGGPAAVEFDTMLDQAISEGKQLWRVPAVEAGCSRCGRMRLVNAEITRSGRAAFVCGDRWALHDEISCRMPDERLRHTTRCKPGACRHYHYTVYNEDPKLGVIAD